jgi:uncharacterized protein YfdQ (DUF2303 family)
MSDDMAEFMREAIRVGASGAPVHQRPDGGQSVIVPEGFREVVIPAAEPVLTRIRQAVTMHDMDSFTAYVNRYKSDATRVFAEPGFLNGGVARMIATFDYHQPQTEGGAAVPEYCAHTATYAPRYSEAWTRWHAIAKAPLKQAEFAEFIEEARADINEPSAATLIDIVRTFKASKRTEFDSVVYQPNGDVRLTYDEKTEQKGQSGALPEQMQLGIPVYYRGEPFAVPVFLRFKVGSGTVQFALKIDRADRIEDEAFAGLIAKFKEITGIEVYLGRR